MFPKGLLLWYFNIPVFFLLLLCLRTKFTINRGPIATKLSLLTKKIGLIKKVVYDGRAAVYAEFKEYYNMSDSFLQKAYKLEKIAVLKSDFRISVSNKLITYWQEYFSYNSEFHCVIPCTLSSSHYTGISTLENLNLKRNEIGYSNEDILLIYSGSTAGWQSFGLLNDFIKKVFKENEKCKVLFLSKEDENNIKLKQEYPERIKIMFLQPNEVSEYLQLGDYGLMLRENSITNQVASPVKYAEYLAAGLKVLISPNIGDYTEFTKTHKCGNVIESNQMHPLTYFNNIGYQEKLALNKLALEHFSKDCFKEQYKLILF
jgi:hypothetical protein